MVTGVNGYIGAALSRRLAGSQWQVRGVMRRQQPGLNAPSLLDGAEISTIEGIGPDTSWSGLLEGVDVLVHLAARVHVMRDTEQNPIDVFRQVNRDGSVALANAAVAAGVRRMVYLSSIKVNGEQTTDRPFSEEDIPAPHDAYAISKWEAEQALRRIVEETGLELVILRPPLVYGPGVKANFLKLLNLVRKGVPLPLASVGNRRSLVALENLVDFIVLCMEHPKAVGETFLVSDGEDISTPDLIRMIARKMKMPARLIPFSPKAIRFAAQILGKKAAANRLLGSLQIDSSKADRLVGWHRTISLDEGIGHTVEWYLRRF